MVPSLLLQSCESSVSVNKTLIAKKTPELDIPIISRGGEIKIIKPIRTIPYRSSIEIKEISGEGNFIEIMKAQNFLKVVSTIETM